MFSFLTPSQYYGVHITHLKNKSPLELRMFIINSVNVETFSVRTHSVTENPDQVWSLLCTSAKRFIAAKEGTDKASTALDHAYTDDTDLNTVPNGYFLICKPSDDPEVRIYERYETVDGGWMYNGVKGERRLVMIYSTSTVATWVATDSGARIRAPIQVATDSGATVTIGAKPTTDHYANLINELRVKGFAAHLKKPLTQTTINFPDIPDNPDNDQVFADSVSWFIPCPNLDAIDEISEVSDSDDDSDSMPPLEPIPRVRSYTSVRTHILKDVKPKLATAPILGYGAYYRKNIKFYHNSDLAENKINGEIRSRWAEEPDNVQKFYRNVLP